MSTDEHWAVTRTIAAPPATVFALLADPTRHQDTEPNDWVLDAVDTTPITEAGQMFAVNMYMDKAGGHYVMHNLVTEFVPERTIAWLPGQLTEAGDHDPGGWVWRYDLAPSGAGTDVTITYDWSGTPQQLRDEIGGLPPFPESFLGQSLDALERALS